MTEPITYVLDTSVLLSSPKAFLTFAEHEVVLPLVVIKELEGKRNDGELGLPARTALKALEALRVLSRSTGEHLSTGVRANEAGGTVRIEVNHVNQAGLPAALTADRTHDTRILAVAKNLASEGKKVVLVSKDLPMRLLAETLGIDAQEYRHEQMATVDDRYTGIVERRVESDLINALYAEKRIEIEDGDNFGGVNTGVILRGPNKQSALARITFDGYLELIAPDIAAFEAKGRSAEQRIALAHLLDPAIGIVSLGGNAGTGKSLIALAAALEAVVEKRTHKNIVVFRPLFAVGGQELGFLPGTEEEKMGPWGAAVFDAVKALNGRESVKELMSRGQFEVLPLTHIRGRTFTDTIMIVDEAQNLERGVLLTALSRLGHNSRVFLTHDVAQRDNLRVGRHDGVAAVVERLKGEALFAHVTLAKSERSKVAALVTDLLDEFEI